jgi:ABC-2 type transport system permease protein
VNRWTGTGRLARLALRRERLRLPLWVLAIGGLAAGIASSVAGLYVTEADRAAQATFAAGNVVTRAFNGPVAGPDLGSLVLVESSALVAVLLGVLVVQLVVRHTRAEEESGRSELVGSAAVGRDAPLAAAILVASLGAVTTGGALALVLAAHGLPVAGAVLSGAALAGVGSVLAAVAAVAVQVAATARAATGLASAVLGAAFLFRAIGDAAGEVTGGGTRLVSAWPSWLSPIGWAQQVRPFADPRVEVLLLPAAATTLVLVVAVVLTSRRDVGAGLRAPTAGAADAGPGLRTAAGLAWRLHRGTITAWLVALVVVGGSFGAVGLDVEQVVGDNPQLLEALTAGTDGRLLDAYASFALGFLAVAASAAAVQVLLRARAEEQAGRVEPLLAAAVSRTRWLAGHVTAAAITGVAGLAVIGLGAAGAFVVLGGATAEAASFLAVALAHVPGVLAVAGVTVAAIGALPRWSAPLAWTVVAADFVLGQLGAVLGFPDALVALSPSSHVPSIPFGPSWWPATVALGLVAVTATAVGLRAFRRRDLVAVA